MARCLRRHGGGIARCLAVIAEHPDPLAYELLGRGLRIEQLGSDDLTWRDLALIIAYPRPGTPLHAALHGADARWDGIEPQLLAIIADRLGHITWQIGGGANTDPPPPLHPGAARAGAPDDEDGPVADEDAYSMDELADLLHVGR